MSTFRSIWRSLQLILHILGGLLITPFVSKRKTGHAPRQSALKIANSWHGRTTRILNVKITTSGTPPTNPSLIVSNHISWLDIIILGHLLPTVFLSKDEVRTWPIIGGFAKAVGTVFIKRGGGESKTVNAIIGDYLSKGGMLTVFPEGTTTDGQTVRHFHSRLFASSIDTNTPVVPLSIRYYQQGKLDTVAPYIGEQSLLDNLLSLIKRKQTEIHIHFGSAIPPSNLDRKGLARKAHDAVCENIRPKI